MLCPPLSGCPDSCNTTLRPVSTPNTEPPRATHESGSFLQPNRLTKPGQAGLNQTAMKGTQPAGWVRGGSAALPLRGATWANACTTEPPVRCLWRTRHPVVPITPSPAPHPVSVSPPACSRLQQHWLPAGVEKAPPGLPFSPLQRMTLG